MADCVKLSTESSYASFAQTLNTMTKKDADERFLALLSSSFPALSTLLEKVHSDKVDFFDGSTDFQSSEKSIKELAVLFPPLEPVPRPKQSGNQEFDAKYFNFPVFAENEKFGKFRTKMDEISTSTQREKLPDSSPEKMIGEILLEPRTEVEFPVTSDPNLAFVEHHIHHDCMSTGLLQFCQGSKTNVYKMFNPDVREMDQIILNPETNVVSENSDKFCTLKLPGPFSYNLAVKELSFGCNSHSFDVFGLLLLIIDSIYALNCVSVVAWNGVSTPLEFTHDIVKVVAIIRSAFPEQFQDLQKLVMYSTVCSTMKKAPLRWNRCMVHVFEDLIMHPLAVISEDTVEFKLLGMIMRKRAKVLCTIFSDEKSSHIFNSSKHRSTLALNFRGILMDEISVYLRTSAINCQENHRVKNIRYELKEKSFRSVLRDIFLSYC